MSLTAAGRFGEGRDAASDARRAVVLGASLGLHALLLLGVIALGNRAAQRELPPAELEMMFQPPSTPTIPLEAAVAPDVPLVETAPSETVQPIAAPDATAPAPPLPAEVRMSTPLPEAAAVPLAAAVTPSAALAPRRPPPVRVGARATVPDRHLVRPVPPGDAPDASMPPVATPAAPTAPRTVSISARWQVELAGWIRSRTRYPEQARQRGEEGAVVISFTVARDGQVLDALLRQRSGSDTLDQAALAMFRAARVPAFPPDMEAGQVTISVPVRYRLEP